MLAAAVLSLATLVPTGASALPPAAAAEVERLLAVLGTSECRFNRNGTWYPGAKAQAHLRTKYEYLVSRQLVHGTEDFIAGAGEKSSMTGEPYQVQCPGSPPQPSAQWLRERLEEIRRTGGRAT